MFRGPKLACPECGKTNLIKLGIIWSGRQKRQQWRCRDCGRATVYPIKVDAKTKVLATSK